MQRAIHLLVSCLTLLASAQGAASGPCDAFLAEAEAVEGVVPRFNEDGSLRSLLMYGEGTFLAPKRSLISSARRKAELRAKRSLASWMGEKLDSDTAVSDLLEQEEVTDGTGNTTGTAKELQFHLDTIRTDTSAAMSGITKLDECMDPDQKVVIVQMGWKPSLSSAAAATRGAIASPGEPGRDGTAQTASGPSSKDEPDTVRSGVTIIVVEAEGAGPDLKRATNEALRSAVAQVFGEQFAAETRTDDLAMVGEVTGTGLALGIAVETSAEQNSVSSKTSGLIESYEYLAKRDTSEGVVVTLEVRLPKFQSSLDPHMMRVVVLRPRLNASARTGEGDLDVFIDAVQDSLEGLLNQAKKLTVLDREFVQDQARELNFVASGNSPITELARLGNTAGADFIVITEIVSFDQKLDSRQVGAQTIERTVFNVETSVKVIDVATTNVLMTKRFPFRKQKTKSANPASTIGQKVGSLLARRLAGKLGGGLTAGAAAGFEPPVDVNAAKRRASDSHEQVKESVKNEW